MQNDQGECVDLYIPRKCSASNRIIHAKDHASISLAFADLDEQGIATGTSKTINICGEIRKMGESDDSIIRLSKETVTGQLVITIMSTSAARMLEPAHTNRLVTQILEQHLQGKEYDLQKSLELSQEIADLVLDKLNTTHATPNGLHKYKYIINCSIQKHGSGLQSSSACLWNTSTDVATCVKYEHRSIDCTVNIYAIAFD